MFILNKISNVITECHNEDVINTCKKDAKHYAVAETIEALQNGAAVSQEAENEPKKNTADTLMHKDEKIESEASEEAEEADEEEGAATSEPLNEAGDMEFEALNAKTVNDLRKIAKECGIQGYGNMNKDTLVAMIMNH